MTKKDRSFFEKLVFYMLNHKEVELSDIGKSKMENSWEGSSKNKWYISAINEDRTINLTSSGHEIYENVSLIFLKIYKI